MKILKESFVSRTKLIRGALVAVLVTGFVVQSEAQIYTLSQNGSSVQVNLTPGSAGVSDWLLNGVNQLNQQWFYYREGSSGPQYSIDTIAGPSSITFLPSTLLMATYANSTISVKTTYTFGAPGNGTATLSEAITVANPSSLSQTYHFFQYSDFWLGGVPGGQSVQFYNNGAPTYYEVIQTGGTGRLVETAQSPSAGVTSEVQAGLYDGTLLGIATVPGLTLNNTLSAGPGNVVYAYEWDATLLPGGSFQISKILTVPEPSSMVLISSGMLVLALVHRRRRGA
jgi:hypothetical protein